RIPLILVSLFIGYGVPPELHSFPTRRSPDLEEQEIGLIAVDSMYSPVSRVRYSTEDARVGQKTDYDRLILEIWTNGTVTPEMARSEEHTSELQSRENLVCRLLLEKKKTSHRQ